MDNKDDKACDLNNKHKGNNLYTARAWLPGWLAGWLAGWLVLTFQAVLCVIVSGSVMMN